MDQTDALACGNEPRSAASLSERIDGAIVNFRQRLAMLVDRVTESGLTPTSFAELTSGLRVASSEAALRAMVATIESMDPCQPSVTVDGESCRFKDVSSKQWLTQFGLAPVRRRYYADDDKRSAVPLDALCGMTDRYLTPEVEEMVAFASTPTPSPART